VSVARVALLTAGAVLLAGCGSDAKDEQPARWNGPPRPDASGKVDVAPFNAFLARERPAAARAPLTAVAEFLRLDTADAGATSISSRLGGEGAGPATVVATLDRLLDDSVRAQRYVLALERRADGTWRVRSAAWSQRCQQGRGHQDFTAAPCV